MGLAESNDSLSLGLRTVAGLSPATVWCCLRARGLCCRRVSVCPSVCHVGGFTSCFWSHTFRAAAQRAAFDRETSGLGTKAAVYAFCDPRSITVAVHLHVY